MAYLEEDLSTLSEPIAVQHLAGQHELQALFNDLAQSQIPEEAESIQLRIAALLANDDSSH